MFVSKKVDEQIQQEAQDLCQSGLHWFDALHIACAKKGEAQFFITCDKQIQKKKVRGVALICPVDFANEFCK